MVNRCSPLTSDPSLQPGRALGAPQAPTLRPPPPAAPATCPTPRACPLAPPARGSDAALTRRLATRNTTRARGGPHGGPRQRAGRRAHSARRSRGAVAASSLVVSLTASDFPSTDSSSHCLPGGGHARGHLRTQGTRRSQCLPSRSPRRGRRTRLVSRGPLSSRAAARVTAAVSLTDPEAARTGLAQAGAASSRTGGPGATRGLKLAPGASAQGTPAREPAEAEVAATSAVSRSSPVSWGLGGQHRPRLQPCRERRTSMG